MSCFFKFYLTICTKSRLGQFAHNCAPSLPPTKHAVTCNFMQSRLRALQCKEPQPVSAKEVSSAFSSPLEAFIFFPSHKKRKKKETQLFGLSYVWNFPWPNLTAVCSSGIFPLYSYRRCASHAILLCLLSRHVQRNSQLGVPLIPVVTSPAVSCLSWSSFIGLYLQIQVYDRTEGLRQILNPTLNVDSNYFLG